MQILLKKKEEKHRRPHHTHDKITLFIRKKIYYKKIM